MFNLFNKSETEIIPVKKIDNQNSNWARDGLVFYVKNGKGLITLKYGYLEDDVLVTLTFDNIPLIKFHANGPYYCPTCEKLVAAGYGLNMGNEELILQLREIMNQKFHSLEKSIEDLKPLLSLLPTGYYALFDTVLCPSDGNGNFFWKVNNKPIQNKGSCPIYNNDGHWIEEMPYYILPSQPPSHFNPEQANFYRNKDDYRALAYHIEGYLCCLLDGHHKAVAAAMDKKKVKTLVIVPTTSIQFPDDNQNGGISILDIFLTQDELFEPVSKLVKLMNDVQLTKTETQKYKSMINSDFDQHYDWGQEILESEKIYPNALDFAITQWAGDLSDERLNRILKKEESVTDQDALYIVTALFISQNPRFKEMAFYFGKSYSFSTVWYKIYELLANIKDEDVENFFVDYLVHYNRQYPEINKIIDNYFSQ